MSEQNPVGPKQEPDGASVPQAARTDEPPKESKRPGWLISFLIGLKSVGKLRDGLLVAGGLFYILGYVVWSINALINGLGLLPALEFQYLVAGIIPALILFVAGLLIRVLLNTGQLEHSARGETGGAKSLLSSKRNVLAIFLTSLIFCVIVSGLIYLAYHPRAVTLPSGGWAGLFKSVGALVPFVLGLGANLLQEFLKGGAGGKAGASDENIPYEKILAVGAASATGLAFLVLWTVWAYQRIPQALGGVKPRCAQLDLVKKDVSADTIAAVSPSSSLTTTPTTLTTNPVPTPIPSPAPAGQGEKATIAPGEEDKIVRSDKVYILFSGSDYILLKNRGGRVYEIKKDVVHTVTACADD